jgi:hypothetical protein
LFYSAKGLRREISYRSERHSRIHPHEVTFGGVPSYVFQEEDGGGHGNFLPASYRAIQADPEWALRLNKAYTAGKRIPRGWERARRELDCANSSDALLMNIFCYPGVVDSSMVCALLGSTVGVRPCFGFKPGIPLLNGKSDRTEIDMSLGSLMVEAKLTESGFQSTPMTRLMRYRDFAEVFVVEELPIVGDSVQSYQLIRGVLAAEHLDRSFAVFCDARRVDLVERWFQIIRAVRHCDLRHRLALVSWQEIAGVLPSVLRVFLQEKYGICQGL